MEARYQAVYFFVQLSSCELSSLRVVSFQLKSCEEALRNENFGTSFSSIRIESFSLGLLESSTGLNETFLSHLPSTVTSLSLCLPRDNRPVDFSLLVKFSLTSLSLQGGGAEFIPEDRFSTFLRVASNVHHLTIREVVFPIVIHWPYVEELCNMVKVLHFFVSQEGLLIRNLPTFFGPQLQELHFLGPASDCYDIVQSWDSTFFPILEKHNLWDTRWRKSKRHWEDLL
jgi:hypothetical protein